VDLIAGTANEAKSHPVGPNYWVERHRGADGLSRYTLAAPASFLERAPGFDIEPSTM
jgi:hypothetical protein